jgi:fructokinase
MDAKGALILHRRIATPQGYGETITALRTLLAECEQAGGLPVRAVGVGMPGSPSPQTGLIRNANSTWLNGKPFAHDLGAALNRPVRLANDANCFALSEATDGAGASARSVFGVILGTGCGGGLVIDQSLVAGAGAIAGEWGHTPLPWASAEELKGPACWCGKTGCLETWISGPAFSADHARVTGTKLDAPSIAEAAARAEPGAQASLHRLAGRIARGLGVVINIVDPEVIVLGGGLSNIGALPALIAARLPAYVFSDHIAARIVKNVHGDSSGVRGAAWLWPAEARA